MGKAGVSYPETGVLLHSVFLRLVIDMISSVENTIFCNSLMF